MDKPKRKRSQTEYIGLRLTPELSAALDKRCLVKGFGGAVKLARSAVVRSILEEALGLRATT